MEWTWIEQVLLVLGAAGGVGSSAVQIGKLLGAVVIGVARLVYIASGQFLQLARLWFVRTLLEALVFEDIKSLHRCS